MNENTKKSLVDVIRSSHKGEYILKLTEYFGGSVDDLVEFRQEWPLHEGNNARYHLEAFMANEGYKLQLFTYDNHENFTPCRFSDIEYAPDKYKSCPEEGNFLLQHKEHPERKMLLVTCASKYDRLYYLSLFCSVKVVDEAKNLIRRFREYIDKNNIYKRQKIQGSLDFIKQDRPYSWDDLVLDPKTLQTLQQNLLTVLTKREIYASLGISSKRGIILSGPPGTGKTMCGKVLCSTMPDWSFIWVSPGDLSRVENIKAYCDLAKTIAPTILFLEDLDLHFQSRDSNAESSLLGELMNQLDGINDVSNIVVIGTTNKPGQLEEALAKRPGRFDKIIKFGNPTREVREQLFQKFGAGKLGDIDWDKLAVEAKDLSGAQVKEVITQAILKILDKYTSGEPPKIQLSTDDLIESIRAGKGKDFTPSSLGFNTGRHSLDFGDD